jgi:hypothetical protein
MVDRPNNKPMSYQYAVVTVDDGAFVSAYDGRLAIYGSRHAAGKFLAEYRGEAELTVRRILVENPWKHKTGRKP